MRRPSYLMMSIEKLSDKELHQLFKMPSEKGVSDRLEKAQSFFPHMQKEIKRPGVTRYRMWEEYLIKHPDGYSRSQFQERYNRWRGTTKLSMRIEHKAGDKLYVDYTGKKLQVIDKQTGECTPVEVFVYDFCSEKPRGFSASYNVT